MSPIRPNLLLVDDEERILRSLSMLFKPRYNVTATVDAYAAIEHVKGQPVHVIVSDQRMPLMRGAELLRRVREISPSTMRLLLTGYSELDAIVASVNDGEVFRFIHKPWDAAQLRNTVDQAAGIAQRLFTAPAAAAVSADPSTPSSGAGILVVDDDPATGQTVREIVEGRSPVHAAASLDEAFTRLEQHDIGVVISEMFVAREPVALALKLLKAEHPEVVTIVLTPFQDTTLFVELINEGQVYRFLPKPLRRGPLGMNIASALRQHRALRTAPELRRAHAVQQGHSPEDPGLATRVLGYLARLRGRAGATGA